MTWCYRDTPEIEREQVMVLLTEQWNARAAIEAGALVPASADRTTSKKEVVAAVAEMRERCAKIVRDICDTQAKGWGENPGGDEGCTGWVAASNCGVFAAAAIRQLDLSPASGGYVVVPRIPTDAMVKAAMETKGQMTYSDVWAAMLGASKQ